MISGIRIVDYIIMMSIEIMSHFTISYLGNISNKLIFCFDLFLTCLVVLRAGCKKHFRIPEIQQNMNPVCLAAYGARLLVRPRPTTKLQQMVLSAQIPVLSNGVERWTHLGLGDLYFDQKF